MTLLVVDDEWVVRDVIELFIRQIHPDAVIIHAEHGAHAWEIMNRPGNEFDYMFSDVIMPKMDGIKLVQKVRKKYPNIRIILMSGTGEPDGHEAHAFLAKPFESGKKLVETIKKLMRKQ